MFSQVHFLIKYFGDTLENFGDTQMCRDTQFEKHWVRLYRLE
jgi:hypothetical protein